MAHSQTAAYSYTNNLPKRMQIVSGLVCHGLRHKSDNSFHPDQSAMPAMMSELPSMMTSQHKNE